MKAIVLAVLACLLPALASAAPLIEGGANNDIFPGTTYNFQEIVPLVAGANSFDFALTTYGTPGQALTTNISLDGGGMTFGNFTLTGPNGIFQHTALFEGENGFLAAIQDVPFVLGGAYNLNLTFSLAQAADALVNVQVSAVPLPAAGLLLLGAIGGLGAIGARRKVARHA